MQLVNLKAEQEEFSPINGNISYKVSSILELPNGSYQLVNDISVLDKGLMRITDIVEVIDGQIKPFIAFKVIHKTGKKFNVGDIVAKLVIL